MDTESVTLILFYHEDSPACQKLKDLLPKDKQIQMVNISQVSNIPTSITSIPALVVNNKEVLLGKKVFDYFNKSDEIEYLNFSAGKNTNAGFSGIGDDDHINSGSMFSTIGNDSMSQGIPVWDDDDTDKPKLDLDKLQNERAETLKSVMPIKRE
jgi:hypothetical protein